MQTGIISVDYGHDMFEIHTSNKSMGIPESEERKRKREEASNR
jgi:hypothetical protein